VLVIMTTLATSTTTWIPILTYPTVDELLLPFFVYSVRRVDDPLYPSLSDSPRFRNGYIYSTVIIIGQIIYTQFVHW